jgi:amino acid transporter
MAERGFLPKVLGYRSKHDTPTLGILLSSLGVLFVATLDFVSIVQMLNGRFDLVHVMGYTHASCHQYSASAIYCLAELLEFAAFIWLRIKSPNLHRPYKVPLPTWGLILMVLPANILLVRGENQLSTAFHSTQR